MSTSTEDHVVMRHIMSPPLMVMQNLILIVWGKKANGFILLPSVLNPYVTFHFNSIQFNPTGYLLKT